MTNRSLVAVVLLLGLVLAGCRDKDSRAEMAKKLEGIAPGEERTISPGVTMKMFRIQATAPIGDGWHLATSTEGGFSVEMPLPFNDFRMRNETTDKVDLRTHTVGAKTAGLLAWTATCFARSDGRLDSDGRKSRPDRSETKGSPLVAALRTVDLEDRTCVLIVEAQGADPIASEADRTRFLGSLKRTGKPVW